MKVLPVIMAGGAGTRLWPLSRDEKPKQFHNLSGNGTLLEETIKRLLPLNLEKVIIVTSKKYETISQEEIEKVGVQGTVLCEPRPRNTAAAVLYASVYMSKLSEDSVMIMLPADHYIKDDKEFVRILSIAVTKADQGGLVSIGIKPSYPETGYGYIKAVEEKGDVRSVDRFVEKPDFDTAKKYIESGQYFWNSGIYIWKTSTIMDNFKKLMPGHVKAFEPLMKLSAAEIASGSDAVWKMKQEIFDSVESVSIDYGIMEKAENRAVIPSNFGWADLGSWKAIDDILTPDEHNNRTPERGRSLFVDAENCSTFSENKRISIVGLSNVVVVEAGNEILVINKNAAQDVRKVVELIKLK